MRSVFVALSLLLALFLASHPAEGQQSSRIEFAKLLTTSTGWAATKNKLFWTTDGGTHWKDITPKLKHKRQLVSSVFFLNDQIGWVLIGCGDDVDPIADDVCFEFASTADAGRNWSLVHPKIVDPVPRSVITEDGQGFSSTSFLDFSDAQHGWAILKRSLPAGRSSGVMLRTQDGGKTWTQLPKDTLPIADHFRFVTARVGWIAGGSQPESDLYVTRDAGDSWTRVAVRPPAEINVGTWPPSQNGIWPDYRLPFFENTKRGFLIGSYWDGSKSISVLFSTGDLGVSWKFERVLPDIDGVITFLDETVFAVSATHTLDKLSLMRLSLSGKTSAPAGVTADIHLIPIQHYNLGASYDTLHMVSDMCGWLLADKLLATSDGGNTWSDITPAEARKPLALKHSEFSTTTILSPQILPGGSMPSAFATPAGNVSSHLGFDKSRVVCPTGISKCNASQSLTVMQSLVNSSPFYDTSLYLPGSPNRGTDSALNLSWVQGAEQQGWGLIPIWFGLQSPCVITKAGITQFFGPTTSDASTQGAQQADQAVAAATALGFTAGIIYTDIENYTVNSTCSPVVQAYVDAWVTEIHAYSGYLAGVYANPGPIKNDISNPNVAQADAIWITKTPGSGKPPQVTIWNQGISDALWPNSQRMHQFLIDQTGVTWGGVAFSPSVDEDIENAPVANANAMTKTYSSYSYTELDYPGAVLTVGCGINGISNGALIKAANQTGQIVGYYRLNGGFEQGFMLDGATYTSVNYPGAVRTYALGINNSGEIVGLYTTSPNEHGFLLSNGMYTSIDVPGNNGLTSAVSINDAGQIVGEYSDNMGNHGFLYYRGKYYYPIDYPAGGGTLTWGAGINGNGTIAGTYRDGSSGMQFGFTENAIPPTWKGTFTPISYPGATATAAQGINNDNQITGGYNGTAFPDCTDSNTVGGAGFISSGGAFTSFQFPGGISTDLQTTNDFSQSAGYYIDSSSVTHGFLVAAVP